MEELASLLLVKRDARRPWRPYKRKPPTTSNPTQPSTILSSLLPNFTTTTTINRLEKENRLTTDTDKVGTTTKNFTGLHKSGTTTIIDGSRATTTTESSFDGGSKFGVRSGIGSANNGTTGSNWFLGGDRPVTTTSNWFPSGEKTSFSSTSPVETGLNQFLGSDNVVPTSSNRFDRVVETGFLSSAHNSSVILDETNDLWWGTVLWDEVGVGGGDLGGGNLSWNVTMDQNMTTNRDGEDDGSGEVVAMVVTAFLLGLIILATVIGNVFVIAAILLERHLQSVANYLILSLAVADLLVACLVMPLGAVYQVSQQWTLGPELCDMWTSSDVLCCTASILHLVAIALDRYWAVTNIDYIHQRTGKRIGLMILVIWCVSFLVCIAPLLGWKDPGWEHRVSQERMCLVSQDIGYQIFATLASFYLPLLVILFLYWRIFQTARKRIRRRVTVATPPTSAKGGGAKGGPQPRGGVIAGLCAAGAAGGSGGIAAAVVGVIGRPLPTISEATTTTTTTTAFTNVSSANTSPEKGSFGNGLEADPPTCDPMSSIGPTAGANYSQPPPLKQRKQPKESAETKRERKAAKTLAIITGAFVICWLPFFIMAILLPGDSGMFHQYVIAFFLWLGYFNSTLNPIIYTVFSPEFRHAFKRLLCGRRASVRRRGAHHNFPR